jgi:hypothetical protein
MNPFDAQPKCPAPLRASRRPVSIRRWWGNDDAEATVKLTPHQWRRICAGDQVEASTWSWYEGKRERVTFRFNFPERGNLYVSGNDGADHFLGAIEEAQIIGAEFPPRQTGATDFTVRESGTLELAGVCLPETRAEAYDLAPDSIADADDILSAADVCQPLSWHLDGECEAAQTAEERPKDTAAWLASLSPAELQVVIDGVRSWLREEPDWGHEDDYIPQSSSGQGAALEYFRDWTDEDRRALGIVVIEGEHPGSSYYAAELRSDLNSANLIAWRRRLPVWFSRDDSH